ncbi:hypothetical protein JCM11251_002167 [Rhodosporidiobolus azoricus]
MFARPAISSLRTVASRPSCGCRAFSSFPPVASPAPSSSTAPSTKQQRKGEAGLETAGMGSADKLANLMKDMIEREPAGPPESESTSTILRHLSPNQVISPQNLLPESLLVPYAPRPDFSRAYPLGPPTEYGATHDPFVRYGIDPLDPSKGAMNSFIPSQYVTSMGKVKSRGQTQLQRKSQRKIGKAIRRARSMGIIPTFGQSLPKH